MAGSTQGGEASAETGVGASDRTLTRLAREQGSSQHEVPMSLHLEVTRSCRVSNAGSMSCTDVSAVKPHVTIAVRVSNECAWDACQAAGAGDHLERRGGHGRVGRRAADAVAASVFFFCA